MANKQKKRPAANDRAKKSFEQRYGMTRSEWARFKKTNPKEAHGLRMKVQNPVAK